MRGSPAFVRLLQRGQLAFIRATPKAFLSRTRSRRAQGMKACRIRAPSLRTGLRRATRAGYTRQAAPPTFQTLSYCVVLAVAVMARGGWGGKLLGLYRAC